MLERNAVDYVEKLSPRAYTNFFKADFQLNPPIKSSSSLKIVGSHHSMGDDLIVEGSKSVRKLRRRLEDASGNP